MMTYAQMEFGMDYDQLGLDNEKEWVKMMK